MTEIFEKDSKTTYLGETKTVTNKNNETIYVPHGNGRLINYPYLFIGQFDNGKLKGPGRIYMQPNCGYGENFDMAKQQNGYKQTAVLDPSMDPNNLNFNFIAERSF